MAASLQSRPYRSHKYPACDTCRRRKIRCHFEVGEQFCRFCAEHGKECTTSRDPQSGPNPRPSKRARVNKHADLRSAQDEDVQAGREMFLSPNEPTTLIVDPTVAEDIDVLDRYLTSDVTYPVSAARLYNRVSESIMYLTLPRRRSRLHTAVKEPGKAQHEIMQHVLSPCETHVIDLYFDAVHPCFPILDETTFRDLYNRNSQRLSSSLMCAVYAVSLCFWPSSDSLQRYPRPDMGFAWNQAVAATNDDFANPSITSIYAGLLVISGRPVNQVTTNICTLGRIVALAHSLGLHRNPTSWKIPVAEQALRIKLWWAVLVHDHWSSFAHGVPPNIDPANYDVPLPTSSSLSTPNCSEARRKAYASFLHFCRLTQILGRILPFVYTLIPNYDEAWKHLRSIECSLDEWHDDLPDYLVPNPSTRSSEAGKTNGASNVWFCFLAVKVLVCRLALRITLRSQTQLIVEAKDYRFALLRDSACAIADYVASLEQSQIRQFWLSHTAHLLAFVTTVLLRCTVDTQNQSTKRESAAKAVRLVRWLEYAKTHWDWDLAEFCLERCREPSERIAASVDLACSTQQQLIPATEMTSQARDTRLGEATNAESTAIDPLFFPNDSLDGLWELLWDDLDDDLMITAT